MSAQAGQLMEWRRGWPVVLTAALGIFMLSLKTVTLGPLLPFIEADTGWGRAEISSGVSISFLLAFFLVPAFGTLADRLGVRLVAIPGVIGFGLSLAFLASSGPGITSWILGWVLLSVAYAAAMPVWVIGVTSHFKAARGMAIALTTSGVGIATITGPLLSALLAENFGWRIAYLVIASVPLLVVLPFTLMFFTDARFAQRSTRSILTEFRSALLASFRRLIPTNGQSEANGSKNTPQSAENTDAGTAKSNGLLVREIIRSRQFWLLALASLCMGSAFPGFSIHIVPMLIEIGQTPTGAAALVASIGAGTITGRILGGVLLDRMHGGLLATIFMIVAVIGLWPIIMAWDSALLLTVALFIFGLAVGVEADCLPFLSSKYFGVKNFGFASSMLTGITAFGASIGPLVGGRIYDMFQDYWYFQMYILVVVTVAGLCFTGLGRYPKVELE